MQGLRLAKVAKGPCTHRLRRNRRCVKPGVRFFIGQFVARKASRVGFIKATLVTEQGNDNPFLAKHFEGVRR